MSVTSCNLTLVHLIWLQMLIQGLKQNTVGLIHILLGIMIQNFQKHHLIAQHRIEHTHHDIDVRFLIQRIAIHFLHVHKLLS